MSNASWPKARGARFNPKPRFERLDREAFDDGWDRREEEDELPPPTTVQIEPARSIITRNDSPDIPFDRSINPYRGCAHGCLWHAIRHNDSNCVQLSECIILTAPQINV
jgi:hypothetical protein